MLFLSELLYSSIKIIIKEKKVNNTILGANDTFIDLVLLSLINCLFNDCGNKIGIRAINSTPIGLPAPLDILSNNKCCPRSLRISRCFGPGTASHIGYLLWNKSSIDSLHHAKHHLNPPIIIKVNKCAWDAWGVFATQETSLLVRSLLWAT